MVDRFVPERDSGHRHGPGQLRKTLAVLLATTALGSVSAHAVDGTWTGGGDEWTDPTHWSSNPQLPDGTATFTINEPTAIQVSGAVSIGAVHFTGTPNAQAYTITANDFFLVNGTGFRNDSSNPQTFNTTLTTIFQNSSTASDSSGATAVTHVNSGSLLFQNSSTAGNAIVTNNGVLQFFDTSTAGSAQVTNKATLDFLDATSAGSANITNAATGAISFNSTSNAGTATITLQAPVSPDTSIGSLTFNNSSSASSAHISTGIASFANITFNHTSTAANANINLVDGNLTFNNSSTAGSATVTMSNVMHPGNITFNDTSSAGNANITNVANSVLGTSVQFLGASTAGNATITNNPGAPAGQGGTLFFGTLGGTDTSNAGTAHITNNQFGSTSFLAQTSAMNATIVNNNGGNTNFQDQSTAGNATIVNNSGGTTSFGVPLVGTDTASAGSAVIINNSGGTTAFFAATTAGSATIINSLGGIVQFGDSGGANDTATAGSSNIDNSGVVSFNSKTTAGSSTITTHSGGNVFFFDTSSGGGARLITEAGGTVDISALTSAGTSAGSIEGAGSYVLGAKNFAVGSNNLSTQVSGVISGTGGSLTKVGTGILILTGANTYSGGTTIAAGTLQLGNGGTTGSIVGNVVDNGVFAINRSNAFVYNGVISGSGAFQQIGTGTTTLTAAQSYTGLTNIIAGTLALTGAGSIASSSGVATNGIFDISGVAGGGTSIKTLSGSGSVVLGARTLTLSNATSTIFAGTIGGSGGLTLSSGNQLLCGNNTYTGATVIDGGTLALTGAGNIASSSGVVANGTFDISTTNSGTSIKTLSGSGSVALGTNTLTLTNASGNFAGVIGGTGGFTLTGGAETLSGANTYTGATTVSAGTLTIAAGGSITSNVTNGATFNNSGAVAGNVSNSGTFANNAGGSVSGLLTNSGIATNAGQLNGGANVSGGTLTNNNLISGAAGISGGIFNNNATVTGTVANAATFNNNAGGTVSGQVTNTAGTTINAGQLNGGASVSGGTLINNNLISGAVGISGGIFNNNATVTGTVSNAATFNNNAGGTVSGRLTNTAGTTTNTGQLNGGATVSGGTLTTTGTVSGGLTNFATVNAAGIVNGPIANNAGTFTTTGALSSNGTFGNASGATLAVGTATYTLQGLLTNSGTLAVASGATLDASAGGITNTASGTITVAAGGTVKDDLNNAGVVSNAGAYVANVATNTGAGSITNAATGTWTGNVLGNAATITNNGVWSGNVASNTGTIINNLTWTGTVSNAGTFNNSAGATVSGLLTNTAGTTTNDGALNGGANVSGGTFTGSGTVTNLNVSGGTFAPGTGTPGSSMTVTGNLALQSGAMYLVTLNPTTSTFANVGGTASLNGTAAAVYLAGNYVSKKYTILTAAGGVTGTFGSLVNTNVPANFTSSLSYDANHAYIDLTLNFVPNPAPNFGPGLNINQQNVANALTGFFNRTGGIPLAFASLTPAGLTQVSGELGTGIIQTAIKADDIFLNLLLDPTVAGRAGGFASGGTGPSQFADDDEALAYAAGRKTPAERAAYAMATKAPYLAPQPVSRWSVWGAAYGGSARVDGNTIVGSHDLTARVWGVAGGADYKVNPDALVGFALAGGGTNYSLSDALGTGRSDLFQAGAFGRQNIGAAYLSAALAYGWHDVTTNRTVVLPAGDVLQARFRAETFSARFEGGYRFATPWAGITPYVAAQAISFNLPAYAEQTLGGLGTFALNYAGQTTTATRTELGLRSDRSWAMQNGIFTLRGRAAWAHDYNNDRAVTAVFQTLPGAAFVVNGARANPDAALVSAGAEMKWLNGFSLAATFEGEFSGNTTSYAGKGVAKYSW